MKSTALRNKGQIIGWMKLPFDSREISAANSARHGGGHPHGHSRTLLRRDCGDDLLCFDRHRIFGLISAVGLAPREGRSPAAPMRFFEQGCQRTGASAGCLGATF
jgi:hypothetical protein